jgi:uncharacterized repeat protein (TIGR01451 family)
MKHNKGYPALILLLGVLLALPMLAAAQEPLSSPLALAPTTTAPGAEIPSPASSSSGLSGTLRDANTGQGLAGFVYVYDSGDPGIEFSTLADQTGHYSLTLPAGLYDLYGAMVGYDRVDGTVTIADGEIALLDFDLPAPVMDWQPRAIDESMAAGENRVVSLVISNTGTSALQYRIDEIAPGTALAQESRAGTTAAGVHPQVYADLAASPDGTAEILVEMSEQADLSAAYAISDWSARGHYVHDRLRATAARSQARVRGYLDGQGIAYRSFVSLNSLALVASQATVGALAAMPGVAAIHPGYSLHIPDPPLEAAVTPRSVGWNVSNVGADTVWASLGVTGQGIVVASIDTGVEWDHDSLKTQYRGWNGLTADHDYNWWDPRGVCSPASEPCDNHWHGTHTMGTMVGSDLPGDPLSAPNAVGLAPGARWITCKGCEMAGGWPCSVYALLECADFMLAPWDLNGQNPDPDLRPHVLNNSWGGDANDGWFFSAVAAWRAAGIFSAFSAGNTGPGCDTVNSPSDYYNVFATGAVDQNDLIASFSARGPSVLGTLKPQVTAPGLNVPSTFPGNTYSSRSGTSMASPHSAGEVALVWSAQPQLTGQVQLTEWLVMHTADPLVTSEECGGLPGSQTPNNTYGWGRINALQAVSTSLAHEWDVGWLEVSPASGSVEPGGSTTISVTLDSTGLGPNACYTAELNLETNDPYLGPAISLPVELCVGLYIHKGADPLQQLPGEPVTYTIVLGNHGDPATGVVVSDVLPSLVEYAWSDPPGTYQDHTLAWGFLTLAPGARVTTTIVVTIGEDVAPSTAMTNTVTLFHGDDDPLVARAAHRTPPLRLYLPAVLKSP